MFKYSSPVSFCLPSKKSVWSIVGYKRPQPAGGLGSSSAPWPREVNSCFALHFAWVPHNIWKKFPTNSKVFRLESQLRKCNLDWIHRHHLLWRLDSGGFSQAHTTVPGDWAGMYTNAIAQGTWCNVVDSLCGIREALSGKGMVTSMNSIWSPFHAFC